MPDPKTPGAGEANAVADVGDLVVRALRRIAGRGRKEVERAAERGRQRLEERQRRKDLEAFWIRLGKTAWRLTEAGEIDHPALRKAMSRIAELERRIAAAEGPAAAVVDPGPEPAEEAEGPAGA